MEEQPPKPSVTDSPSEPPAASAEVKDASGSDSSSQNSSSYAAMNAGYVLVASVAVGLLIGWVIDEWAGTRPWWMAGMAGLFIIAGLYQVVKEHWKD